MKVSTGFPFSDDDEISREKKARESKRKQHVQDVKEIKMRYKIEDHDFQVKLKHAQKFLTDGDKIKVLIVLRGREMQHSNMAIALMNRFAQRLAEIALVKEPPELENKQVKMLLAPRENPLTKPT